jgi:tellurium resistance protein TerD
MEENMPVCLQKGQKVSLTKDNPGLSNVVVGLGWDVNAFDTGGAFDLDSAAFLLTESGKVSKSEDFVFYGNLKHPSGAVEHLGDNTTGAGDGDDEQIKITLSAVPAEITKIAFTVTIYDADARRQNFGQVSNSYIRIYNEENGEELLRYDLGEDFSIETASVFGELYRNNDEWKFNAIGSGYQGGLAALCGSFGVDVE